MSCSIYTQIPAPPTTKTSCAVPLGGSNTTILDACCNQLILFTYNSVPSPSASSSLSPNSPTTTVTPPTTLISSLPFSPVSTAPLASLSNTTAGCFQYCQPPDARSVQTCLAKNFDGYTSFNDVPLFQCFSLAEEGKTSGAAAVRGRVGKGGVSKWMVGAGVVWVLMGLL